MRREWEGRSRARWGRTRRSAITCCFTRTEADPRALVDGYGALRDWAHNSLDLYKVRDARAREEEEREETMVGGARRASSAIEGWSVGEARRGARDETR